MKIFTITVETGESPAAASLPSYALSSDDPDVRMHLEINLDEIITKYASYVACLRSIIEEKGVSPEELCSYLLSLSAFSKSFKGQKLALMSDMKSELNKKNDKIIDIFDFLTTEYASFLNYDIFQKILEHYNISEDQDPKLKYRDHLKAYIEKHKISEFLRINPWLEKQKKGSKEVSLKYDIENTSSLARVDELKKIIAKIMKLDPATLHIVDIEDGCAIMTFLIPASVADAIFTPGIVFTSQQEDEFRAASVLWFKCNGCTFHFGDGKVKEDTQTDSPGRLN